MSKSPDVRCTSVNPSAMPKIAEIIAVGSELLTPQRIDTNSLIVTEHFNLLGVEVIAKHVIGDERERLDRLYRVPLWNVRTSSF